jgi:tellurium resistance protein TerD
MADIFDTEYEGKAIELGDGRVKLGDNINITAKDPTMHKIMMGMGWDLNVFNTDALDLDFSAFLIGKDGLTRSDDDFVFYNQPQACEGGIKHGGDSRTGAGDGDDETISIDLHSVPYDVMKIVFTLTIYKGQEKNQNLGMVRNSYLRMANEITGIELLRYELAPLLEDKTETGAIIGSLNREGPKWHFTPLADLAEEGLKYFAERFGHIIVQQ